MHCDLLIWKLTTTFPLMGALVLYHLKQANANQALYTKFRAILPGIVQGLIQALGS